jgi:hypothetical protein
VDNVLGTHTGAGTHDIIDLTDLPTPEDFQTKCSTAKSRNVDEVDKMETAFDAR